MLLVARKYYPNNIQNAKDLVGETVLRALNAKERFDNSRPLMAWCRVIMKNVFLTQQEREIKISFASLNESISYSILEADHKLKFRELTNLIRIAKKKSKCIDCLIDVAKGYNYQEIAEKYSIPVGTVRSRINSSRNLLETLIKCG